MNFKNLIAITGNLGADPTVISQKTETGMVLRMSIANNEGRFNKETKEFEETHTNWIPVTMFGHLAERASVALKKGDSVTVFGSLRVTPYQTKEGNKATGFEVIASEVTRSEILHSAKSESISTSGTVAISAANSNTSSRADIHSNAAPRTAQLATPLVQPMTKISVNHSRNSVSKSV